MSNAWKTIFTIVITAVIAGGGTYYWQQNTDVNEDVIVTDQPIVETEKVFDRDAFSFTYPAKYIVDDNALWTEQGYHSHLNPGYGCDMCQTPNIKINNFNIQDPYNSYYDTLEEYMVSRLGLPNADMFEEVKIGNNDFIKVVMIEMMYTAHYYTEKNNEVVEFVVYSEDRDNQELEDMMATLEFK